MDDFDDIELELFNERGDMVAEAEALSRSIRQDVDWLVTHMGGATDDELLAVASAGAQALAQVARLTVALLEAGA